MRFLIIRAVALVSLCLSNAALAHHPTSAFGLSAAAPQSMVELESRWAKYPTALDGRGGSWVSSALRIEYAFSERLSLAANLPFARVSPNDTGSAMGIGDAELAAKWSIMRPARGFGHLSVGTGIELPTGTRDKNIGSGHFELSPFITYQTRALGHVVGFARLNYMVAFGDGDHHHHGDQFAHVSVLAPHEEHEVRTLLGAAWVENTVYVSTSVDNALPLSGPGSASGIWSASLEVGVTAVTDWRFALAWDQPLSSDRRTEGMARLGIAYWFAGADE
ncbi:MAG: hypothetical protein VX589_18260 [Myxococcota bacterium]|nr:hypothetical protein [Myxococcota bacterium]